MLRRTPKWPGTLGLTLVAVACTSLPEVGAPDQEGTVASQALPSSDVVPLEWGRLVSVTQTGAPATIARLWFQDDSGSVRVVTFNFATLELGPQASLINRK